MDQPAPAIWWLSWTRYKGDGNERNDGTRKNNETGAEAPLPQHVLTHFDFAPACAGGGEMPAQPVTITLWHVYGGQTDSPLNDMIDVFNRTVGKEEGIRVEVPLVSNNKTIHEFILGSAYSDPGRPELPDHVCGISQNCAGDAGRWGAC